MKLAGALAQLWGNAEFELPPLPQLSVLAGIALHDRAFGYLDDLPVGTEAVSYTHLTLPTSDLV